MTYFNYNGLSESSGVYVIFNSHNWRIYVGSSKRFRTRWKDGHVRSLLLNKHSNKFLQADFNKCKELLGHDEFLEFHVLENMPRSTREERLKVEEKWIKVHFDGGKNCYNLSDKAISREGFGSFDPEETKRKHSEASKKLWQNPAYREQQSKIQSVKTKEQWQNSKFRADKIKGMTGATGVPWTEERKIQESSRMKQATYAFKPGTFVFKNPQGDIVTIHNLTQYCQEHPELCRSGLSQLVSGRKKSYKGWTL